MVTVRVFGALLVEVDNRSLGPRDFGGIKPKQILEILLVHGGQPVSKDRIADLIWGDALPKDWRRAVETYVSVLRTRLGAPGRQLVVTAPNAYRFAVELVSLDTRWFDELVARAMTLTGRERGQVLDEAIALADGDVLADEPYATWARALRDLYHERLLGALLDAAEAYAGVGEPERALAYAERVVADQPTRERAYRIAMAAHSSQGERALALLDYDRCRKALREAVGVHPAPETERLYLNILNEQPTGVDLAPRRTTDPVPAQTCYAFNGPVSLAYMIVGKGPPDVALVKGFVSHVEACWEWPQYGSFLHRLASGARLIVFDKRGTGMSDPAMELPDLDARAGDLSAVLDEAGSDRAVLIGQSEGGPLAIHFAARHPDRVSGLVLYGTFPRLLQAPDYPHGLPDRFFEAFLDRIKTVWATGGAGDLVNPSAAEDEEFREWVGRYFRLCASPGMARALLRMGAQVDVRHLLGQVSVPTLVLHRRGDQWIRPHNGRYLAERIPNARFVELPGADHWPFVGDTEPVLAAIQGFLDELLCL